MKNRRMDNAWLSIYLFEYSFYIVCSFLSFIDWLIDGLMFGVLFDMLLDVAWAFNNPIKQSIECSFIPSCIWLNVCKLAWACMHLIDDTFDDCLVCLNDSLVIWMKQTIKDILHNVIYSFVQRMCCIFNLSVWCCILIQSSIHFIHTFDVTDV